MRLSNFLKLFLASVLALSLTGCIYVDVKAPLDQDVRDTTLGPKTGKSTSHSVAWLVAWGDAGTQAAAKNGDIENITHLDAHYFSVLFGLYARRDTIAYGY